MKTVLILSGGMDSVTLLYQLVSQKHEVKALGFDYGQRHSRELESAKRLCEDLGVPFTVMNLRGFAEMVPNSSQTDLTVEVPEGHYEEESMKKTVVPNRNMVMLSVAAAHALAIGYTWVAYAAHAGDHAIYPDCRPEFVKAINAAFAQCDWKNVQVFAPYVEASLDKGDIAKIGVALGVPYHLTWTCYKGLDQHCGVCGSCRERKDAFKKHGLIDPTNYME